MEELNYHYKYPHPALTADCAVFGLGDGALHILLIERAAAPYKGHWALPGGFMDIDETIEQCAARELREETGLAGLHLEQFHTFSTVDRDPRERVVSVAFYGVVRRETCRPCAGDDAARARWFALDSLPPLAFDHGDIIDRARKCLAEAVRRRPQAPWPGVGTFSPGELRCLVGD